MIRVTSFAFAAAVLLAAGGAAAQEAAPFATPSAHAPTPTPDPAIVSRAKLLFSQLQAGKLDRSQLDETAASNITEDKVKQAQGVIGPLGAPVTFEQQYIFVREGVTAYVYLLTFGNGTKYDFSMDVDGKGKIAGLLLLPPQ
jgi:hypothetical protein